MSEILGRRDSQLRGLYSKSPFNLDEASIGNYLKGSETDSQERIGLIGIITDLS